MDQGVAHGGRGLADPESLPWGDVSPGPARGLIPGPSHSFHDGMDSDVDKENASALQWLHNPRSPTNRPGEATAFYQRFVPRVVHESAASGVLTASVGENKLLWAEQKDMAILIADISGFTKLSDQFHERDQDGIDYFTTAIKRIMAIICNVVESWNGDVVKFAGDAVIVTWELKGDAKPADVVMQAVRCAQELNASVDLFKVTLPSKSSMPFADQMARYSNMDSVHLTNSQCPGPSGDTMMASIQMQMDQIEVMRRLKQYHPSFERLSMPQMTHIVGQCHLVQNDKGDLVASALDERWPEQTLIVHTGEVNIFAKPSHQEADSAVIVRNEGSANEYGSLVGVRREGDIISAMALSELRYGQLDKSPTKENKTVVWDLFVIAGTNCSFVVVDHQGLRGVSEMSPELFEAATSLLEPLDHQNKDAETVLLRVHQAVSFGTCWVAQVGGEVLSRRFAPRREMILIGSPVMEAAQAMNSADPGKFVVAQNAWQHISSIMDGHPAKAHGTVEIIGPSFGHLYPSPLPAACMLSAASPLNRLGEDAVFAVLNQYCHEGVRGMQKISSFSADIRRMTVCFMKLDVQLCDATRNTLQVVHSAFCLVQRIVYEQQGTIRQFIQDDKGLVVIAVFGMPPFTPKSTDAWRGVHAMLKIRESLKEMGIKVAIGTTTGTAYSGYVGSAGRGEMCAMGSVVNTSARMMSLAGSGTGDFLVDLETFKGVKEDRVDTVTFSAPREVQLKGMVEPTQIFSVIKRLDQQEVRQSLLEFLQREVISITIANQLSESMTNELLSTIMLSWTDQLSLTGVREICNAFFSTRIFAKRSDFSRKDDHESLDESASSEDNNPQKLLLKIAFFVSHARVFGKNMVEHVFSESFPAFTMQFEAFFHALVAEGFFIPVQAEEMEVLLSAPSKTCKWCQAWESVLGDHHRNIFPDDGDSFYKIPEGNDYWVLKVNQRVWHRSMAGLYEKMMGSECSANVIGHHLLASIDIDVPDQSAVMKAVDYLEGAAHAAISSIELKRAMRMLSACCGIMDTLPYHTDIVERKREILEELASHTLLVYGHGSEESLSVYNSCKKLNPRLSLNDVQDERTAYLLVGICANFCAQQKFDLSCDIARRILCAAVNTRSELHTALGLISLLPAMYGMGRFGDMAVQMESLSKLSDEMETPLIVNDVHGYLSAFCWMPSVTLLGGNATKAARECEKVLALAAVSGHPPTESYVYAVLSSEYLPLTGDFKRSRILANKALEIADNLDLRHCRVIALAALNWCQACSSDAGARCSCPSSRSSTRRNSTTLQHLPLIALPSPTLIAVAHAANAVGRMPRQVPRMRREPSESSMGGALSSLPPSPTMEASSEGPRLSHIPRRLGASSSQATSNGSMSTNSSIDDIDLEGSPAARCTSTTSSSRAHSVNCLSSMSLGSHNGHRGLAPEETIWSLLPALTLAENGKWFELQKNAAARLAVAKQCGSFLVSAYTRLHATALYHNSKEQGLDEKTVTNIREEYAYSIALSKQAGLSLFTLAACVDQLKFEGEIWARTGEAIMSDHYLTSISMLEACAIIGGASILLFRQAQDALNQYKIMAIARAGAPQRSPPGGFERPMSSANARNTQNLETELASVSFVLGKMVAGHDSLHPTLVELDESLAKRSPIVDEITSLLENAAVQACLARVDDWTFDMFTFNQATNGKPLQVLSYYLFERHGLFKDLPCNNHVFAAFIQTVEDRTMQTNPFHNSMHIADVTRFMHVLLIKSGIKKAIGPVATLGALFAAMIHDYEHQGVTNEFLIRMGSNWANDFCGRSPNENHHVSAALVLLEEMNFMSAMPELDQTKIRKLAVEMVLATDMDVHSPLVVQLRDFAETIKLCVGGATKMSDMMVATVLSSAIKIADLSHCFSDWSVHSRWAHLLEEEMFRQGDLERALGQPLDGFRDRQRNQGLTTKQDGFFSAVCEPLVSAWLLAFPSHATLLQRMKGNKHMWRAMQGYDATPAEGLHLASDEELESVGNTASAQLQLASLTSEAPIASLELPGQSLSSNREGSISTIVPGPSSEALAIAAKIMASGRVNTMSTLPPPPPLEHERPCAAARSLLGAIKRGRAYDDSDDVGLRPLPRTLVEGDAADGSGAKVRKVSGSPDFQG